MNRFILLIIFLALTAYTSLPIQARTITGTVTDNAGEPLIGATVRIKGNTKESTVSDMDGKFSISSDSNADALTVSYVGFSTASVRLSLDQTDYSIVLNPASEALDEVVVVGYATQKKIDLTGAVSSISAQSLEDRPITNVTNALAGVSAGLAVTNSGGNTPGYESQSILIRGQGTLNDSSPLVVVDGMTGIALSDLNPSDIESIAMARSCTGFG